jgi:hypothetical protein
MWDDCNDALYTAITPGKVLAIQSANSIIWTLYLEGAHHVLCRDCHIFNTPLDIILAPSLPKKLQWTNTVQLAQAALTHYREWAPPPRTAHCQAQQALSPEGLAQHRCHQFLLQHLKMINHPHFSKQQLFVKTNPEINLMVMLLSGNFKALMGTSIDLRR